MKNGIALVRVCVKIVDSTLILAAVSNALSDFAKRG